MDSEDTFTCFVDCRYHRNPLRNVQTMAILQKALVQSISESSVYIVGCNDSIWIKYQEHKSRTALGNYPDGVPWSSYIS